MVNEGYSSVFDFNIPHLVFNLYSFLHLGASNLGGTPLGGAPRLPDAGAQRTGGGPRGLPTPSSSRTVRLRCAPYRALTPGVEHAVSSPAFGGCWSLSPLDPKPVGCAGLHLP